MAVAYDIRVDDLRGPEIIGSLAERLRLRHATVPPESRHVSDEGCLGEASAHSRLQ